MPYRVDVNSASGSRKILGVQLPFGTTSTDSIFNPTYQTVDMYKSNIINYLLTGLGERYMNPGFGTTLQGLLFSQGGLSLEQRESIAVSIEQDLHYFFPKLTINSVTVEELENQIFQIYINFTVTATGIGGELVVDFN